MGGATAADASSTARAVAHSAPSLAAVTSNTPCASEHWFFTRIYTDNGGSRLHADQG
jgi:hypothetical protein